MDSPILISVQSSRMHFLLHDVMCIATLENMFQYGGQKVEQFDYDWANCGVKLVNPK